VTGGTHVVGDIFCGPGLQCSSIVGYLTAVSYNI
jgi:hypothetical protein